MFSLMRVGRSASVDAITDAPSASPPTSTGGGALQALKAAGFGLRYPEPTDPEYVALRAATDALADALDAALGHAKSVDAAWAKLSESQVAFAGVLHAVDRRDEELGEGPGAAVALGKAARAMTSTQGVGPAANGGCRVNSPHAVALDQVRRYLAHLRGIQGRVRDVCKAKAEYDGLASKAARPATAGNAASLAKYAERAAQAGRMYDAMLARLVERMEAAMERRPRALALVNHAFWLQQARIHAQMGQVQEVVFDAARASEPLLVSTGLMQGLNAPSGMFAVLDTRSGAGRGVGVKGGESGANGGGRGLGRSGGGGGRGGGTAVANEPAPGFARSRTEPRRYGDLAPVPSQVAMW